MLVPARRSGRSHRWYRRAVAAELDTQEVVVGRIELLPASRGAVVAGAIARIAVQLALKIEPAAAGLARLLWLLRPAARITRTTATPACACRGSWRHPANG